MLTFRRLIQRIEDGGDPFRPVPWIPPVVFSAIFLPLTLLLSARRPLWFDEIYTVNISRYPSFSAMWHLLNLGGDLQPPLMFLLSRWAQALFGPGEWAIRLPSTLGFLVAGLCLMQVVARRTSPVWGFAGAIFLLLTGAFSYAIEARPYGLVLGCAGLALLCWQYAGDDLHRNIALPGLTLSLAVGLLSNYYAVLLFVPLVLGEAVRTYSARKLDRGVWISMGLAICALILIYPLLIEAMHATAGYRIRAPIKPSIILETYKYLFESTGVVVALLALLVLGTLCGLAGLQAGKSLFRAPEIAAALGLLALPIPALVIAMTVTHRLRPHYMLPLTLGAGILFIFVAYRATGASTAAGLALAAILSAMFVLHAGTSIRSGSSERTFVITDDRYPNLPVVISSGFEFVKAWYYSPPEIQRRILFVSDPANAMHYVNTDALDISIAGCEPIFHWPVVDFSAFRQQHKEFLLNWTHEASWLLPVYRNLGANIELLDVRGDTYLYLIRYDGGAAQAQRN